MKSKDTERLDWLSKTLMMIRPIETALGKRFQILISNDLCIGCVHKNYRKAIDAAMAAERGGWIKDMGPFLPRKRSTR